jgi:serine/threonine protein kinase
MTELIGKTISHYKILEEIGSGSMGIVYKAEDIELKRFVALKFLPPELVRDKDFKERFVKEAQAASALDHSNICTIYEINKTEDGQMFIVMAYYEGETLKEKIDRDDLETSEIINIVTQIAEGLTRAHESGIIHRDIKPANIIITKRGEVKIVDFGLAKTVGQAKITKTGSPLGTVSYMSPEQAKGSNIDHRTDIWSLGILLYELVTKQVPFKGENAHSILYSVLNDEPTLIENSHTKPFYKIFQKTLAKNPANRYQSVNDFIFDLHNIAGKNQKDFIPSEESNKAGKQKIVFTTVSLFIITFLIFGYFFFNPFKKNLPPWLQPDAKPDRYTAEPGIEKGRISPNGASIVYSSEDKRFRIKDLITSEIRTLIEPEGEVALHQPIWSPDGSKIAIANWGPERHGILIYSSELGIVTRHIFTKRHVYYPAWSPDNTMIAYSRNKPREIAIVNVETLEEQSFQTKGFHPVWSPNSEKIAFITENKTIRLIDVNSGILSDTLKYAKPIGTSWKKSGMAWSPDGRYLIYVGENGSSYDFFALPLNPKDYSVTGPPIQFTHFNGICEPCWPTFAKNGNFLSFGQYENNWDIYIMDLDINRAKITGKPIEISKSKHNDIQPCWMPEGNGIVFVSDKDGQPELYKFLFNSDEDQPKRLTFSKSRERFPQVSPKGDIISFFSDKAIWGISPYGGSPVELISFSTNIKNHRCGKHVWSKDGNTIYAIIPDHYKPKEYSSLVKITLGNQNIDTLFSGLGYSHADVAINPDGKLLAISGFLIDSGPYVKIKIYDLEKNEIKMDLIKKYGTTPYARISWTKDGKYILHDKLLNGIRRNELIPVDGSSPKTIDLSESGLKGGFFLDQLIRTLVKEL